jgi:23S rRNA (guanosine2251-2'-O)-methyltransferase
MRVKGYISVCEALKSGKLNRVFYNPESDSSKILNLIIECRRKGIPTIPKKISGIEGDVSPVEYASFDFILKKAVENITPIVMLDKIKDPANLGAVIRTAEFLGCAGVVIAKRRGAQITDAVVRVSTGAVFHIPIAREENLVNCARKAKKIGLSIIGAEIDGDNLENVNISPPVVLVFGEEDRGISKPLRKQCDFIVRIRGYGITNSLNVSNAAAIIIYESMKQKELLQ